MVCGTDVESEGVRGDAHSVSLVRDYLNDGWPRSWPNSFPSTEILNSQEKTHD
jgi:hypothetical protein